MKRTKLREFWEKIPDAARRLGLGAAAGLINGLLGAGGGILVVRTLPALLTDGESRDGRDVFATALAVMLPVSAVSAVVYFLRGSIAPGNFDFVRAAIFAVTGTVGGSVGALLLSRADVRLVRLIFAAITVWSGISMLR